MDIKLLSPSCWTDYELIDSGAFEKLERFGRYVIARFPMRNGSNGPMLISRRTRRAKTGASGFVSLKCHNNGS